MKTIYYPSNKIPGSVEAGLANLKQGMSLLASRAAWRRFYNAGNRIANELNQLGLKVEPYAPMKSSGWTISLLNAPIVAAR